MRETDSAINKPIQACRKRWAEHGFTFIELTAVIAILSIIAVVAVPKLSSGRFRAQSGAHVVASDLMSARMEAMVTASSVTVGFLAGKPSYGFGADRTRDLSKIDGRLFIETGESVTFNSLGEPAGLTARRSVTVSDGTDKAVVYIEPYTGLATTQ
jgi:prepilin-type N-terminal cleavage/methylation domain-containing protein